MKYKYWLACMVERIGNQNVRRLFAAYQSAEEIFLQEKKALTTKGMLKEAAAEKLVKSKDERDWEIETEKMYKKGIRLITIEEKEYPPRLKEICDAPYAIFVKGNLPANEGRTAAIIGARECTAYGREIAEKMGELLASCGVAIISGMARGIDSAGHRGALLAKGKTYAVLGCGIDICYPPENGALYERIGKECGLISEYPPGSAPLAAHFPQRNRIISGLSDVIIVVEAKMKSGSLITADLALEQGKDVYAVPGRVNDALSYGANRLIKQGAGVILSPEDFLLDLGILFEKSDLKKKFSRNSLEKEEVLVYSVLDLHSKNINEIIDETDLTAPECVRALMGLQEKGYIRETYQNYYIRRL